MFAILVACQPPKDIATSLANLCNAQFEPTLEVPYAYAWGSKVAVKGKPKAIFSCTERACDAENACCNTCDGFVGFQCPTGSKFRFIEFRSGGPDEITDGGGDGGMVMGDADAGGIDSNVDDFLCAGTECEVTCGVGSLAGHGGVVGYIDEVKDDRLVLGSARLGTGRGYPYDPQQEGCGLFP